MKILGVETHFGEGGITNAADWWRTILPLQHLKRLGHEVEIMRGFVSPHLLNKKLKLLDNEVLMDIRDTMSQYDIMHQSYNNAPILYSALSVIAEKTGCEVNIDNDDNLLEPDYTNPNALLHEAKNPTEPRDVRVILEDNKHFTVTSEFIRHRYDLYLHSQRLRKHIEVIPNFIDLDMYKPATEKPKRDQVTIGFFGSTSHQADLYDKHFLSALSRVRKLPGVKIEILGNFVPGYLKGLGNVTIHEGEVDFHKWVDKWDKIVKSWDIGVAPLRATNFNKCRSQIKFLEYAAALVPMVASDIGVYDSKNVLKAKSKQEWIQHMTLLVEDRDYRLKLAESALNEVKENYTIQSNISKWEDYFKQILPKAN